MQCAKQPFEDLVMWNHAAEFGSRVLPRARRSYLKRLLISFKADFASGFDVSAAIFKIE
jgi:hypothetical protein